MKNKVTKAVLCTALFTSNAVSGSDFITEHRGLTVNCNLKNSHIRLHLTTRDKKGKIQLTSDSGNRFSSTINKGSSVNYSLNVEQFPVTVAYDANGKRSEFIVAPDCSFL